MNRLRVAVVTPSFPPKGGGVAAAHYNLVHLLKRRYEVKAFAYDDDDRTVSEDVVRRKSPRLAGAVLAWAFGRYLRRYDRTADFQRCRWIALRAAGAWRLGEPLRRYRPDVIVMPDHHLPGYFIRKPHGSKIVWYSHNLYPRFRDNPLLNGHWADVDVASSMERKALRKADAVISPSEYMARELEKCYGTAGRPSRVIHYFIDPGAMNAVEAHPWRSEMGIGPDLPVVYLPSAGSAIKGKRFTGEIVRRIARGRSGNVAFFLSGAIPADLSFELDRLRPSLRLHTPGSLPWQQNLAHVRSCDLCVSPTLADNFSNALIEALWFGKPVVTFDTGGNKEFVLDDRNGHVVDYLDVGALVERSLELLDHPERREAFGHCASETVRRLLDANRLLEQFESLFALLGIPSRGDASPINGPQDIGTSFQ